MLDELGALGAGTAVTFILGLIAEHVSLGAFIGLVVKWVIGKMVTGYISGKAGMVAVVFGILALEVSQGSTFFEHPTPVDTFFTEARDLLFTAISTLVLALVFNPEVAGEADAGTAGMVLSCPCECLPRNQGTILMSTLHDVLGIVMPMVTLLCGFGGPLFGYSMYRRAKQRALQMRYALRIGLYYTIGLECIALMALLYWIGRATGLHTIQDVFALTIVPLLVAAQVMRNRAEKLETHNDRTANLNR